MNALINDTSMLGFIYATLLTVIYQMQSFTNEKNGMVVFKRCELNF